MKAQMYGVTQATNWPPPTPDVASPTELGRISDRIAVVLKEMMELNARLHSSAERALGPVPTGSGEAGTRPQAAGMVSRIDDQLTDVEVTLGRCIEAADRFERLA